MQSAGTESDKAVAVAAKTGTPPIKTVASPSKTATTTPSKTATATPSKTATETPSKTATATPSKTAAGPAKPATPPAKPAQEIDKKTKTEPSQKNKLYSGVVYEQADDEKPGKARTYTTRMMQPDYTPTERTSSSSFKSPSTSNKKPSKEPEPPSATVLSTALEYIRSPVRYIASVFSSQPQEPDKNQAKSSADRNNRGQLKSDFKQVPTPKIKDTTPPKNIEATSHAPESTSGKPSTGEPSTGEPSNDIQDKTGTLVLSDKSADLLSHFLSKEKLSLPKNQDNKKSHDLKRSQSQTIRSAPRSYIAASPRSIAVTGLKNKKLASTQSPKVITNPNVKINQSNRSSYRVTSAEDVQAKSKKEPPRKVFKYDKGTPITYGMNNSSKSRYPPTVLPGRDELSFSHFNPRSVLGPTLPECSNSTRQDWKLVEEDKYAFKPHLVEFRTKSFESSVYISPVAMVNKPTVIIASPTILDTSSHDREVTPVQEIPISVEPLVTSISGTPKQAEPEEKSVEKQAESYPPPELEPTFLVPPISPVEIKPPESPKIISKNKRSENKKKGTRPEVIILRTPSQRLKKTASPKTSASATKKKSSSPGKTSFKENEKNKSNKSPKQSAKLPAKPPKPIRERASSPISQPRPSSRSPGHISPSHRPRSGSPPYTPTYLPPAPTPAKINEYKNPFQLRSEYRQVLKKNEPEPKSPVRSAKDHGRSASTAATASAMGAAAAATKPSPRSTDTAQEKVSSSANESDPQTQNNESWLTQAIRSLSPRKWEEDPMKDSETKNETTSEATKQTPDAPFEISEKAKETPEVIKPTPEVIKQTPCFQQTPEGVKHVPEVVQQTPKVLKPAPVTSNQIPEVIITKPSNPVFTPSPKLSPRKKKVDVIPTEIVVIPATSIQISGSEDIDSQEDIPYFAPSATMFGEFP